MARERSTGYLATVPFVACSFWPVNGLAVPDVFGAQATQLSGGCLVCGGVPAAVRKCAPGQRTPLWKPLSAQQVETVNASIPVNP